MQKYWDFNIKHQRRAASYDYGLQFIFMGKQIKCCLVGEGKWSDEVNKRFGLCSDFINTRFLRNSEISFLTRTVHGRSIDGPRTEKLLNWKETIDFMSHLDRVSDCWFIRFLYLTEIQISGFTYITYKCCRTLYLHCDITAVKLTKTITS